MRKTKPKLETPFKCYIYQTLPKWGDWSERDGRVVGEFVCDRISLGGNALLFPGLFVTWEHAEDCLSNEQILAYAGSHNWIYGWHISDLKIYEKPKQLGEFVKPYNAKKCPHPAQPKCGDCDICYLKRPPQSWCYVEDRSEDDGCD